MLRANRPILAYFDAIKSLRVRQLAMILKAGYDPNLMLNARGQNGLQFMIEYFGSTDAHFRLQAPINKSAYLSIAKLLLDSGLDPNAIELLNDETVIFDAIRFNDKEMVSMLLNYVDLSLRNKNGETALMCAARFGSKQVMRLILEHLRHLEMDGYFLRQRNRFGLSALELARAENLETAKVLTKHLIAYGHNTGAMLSRSSSHHQLARPPYAAYLRPAAAVAARRPLAAAELFSADDLSASDYEPDLAALVGSYGRPRASVAYPYAGTAPGQHPASAYYDPKAAEFNQYLLEQRELMGGSGPAAGPSGRAGGGAPGSDDDEYGPAGQAGGPGTVAGGGPLTRSRSCMLGPSSSGANKPKYGAPEKERSAAGKMAAAATWEGPSSSGRMG